MIILHIISLVILVMVVIHSCIHGEVAGVCGFFCAVVWCSCSMVSAMILADLKENLNLNRVAIEKRAIETDMAHFDSKTGEFTWSDNNMKFVIEGYEQE